MSKPVMFIQGAGQGAYDADAKLVEDVLVDCIRAADGRGLLVGPGCSAEIGRTPAANFQAMRRAAELAAAP